MATQVETPLAATAHLPRSHSHSRSVQKSAMSSHRSDGTRANEPTPSSGPGIGSSTSHTSHSSQSHTNSTPMTHSISRLPSAHKALILAAPGEGPRVEYVATPQPTPGSAIVKVLAANVLSHASQIFSGSANMEYPFPTPLVPGSGAVAQVVAIGSDATVINVGDLVLVDIAIRARDDPKESLILQGFHQGLTSGSKRLITGEWRNSTYAEYAKLPLENLFKLPDPASFGVSISDLAYLGRLLTSYGGLRDCNVRPGETVIVCPATGSFGGATVEMALAIGARVVAAGKSAESLEQLKEGISSSRLRTVQLSGDVNKDARALGKAHVYIDWTPPEVEQPSHIKSCLLALRSEGRASFMGGMGGDVSIPYLLIVGKSLKLSGRLMYDHEAAKDLINMLEAGLLRLGGKVIGEYKLEQWSEAFQAAQSNPGWGKQVLFVP